VESSATSDTGAAESVQRVIEVLARRPIRARFVVEIGESLRQSGSAGLELDQALAELESRGDVIVMSHDCADPHLEGADLRIAAIVGPTQVGGDAQATAIDAIEAAWQRWLGDYLANHRCT
jgi:hypothetical protein